LEFYSYTVWCPLKPNWSDALFQDIKYTPQKLCGSLFMLTFGVTNFFEWWSWIATFTHWQGQTSQVAILKEEGLLYAPG